ncbi:2-oxoacid:acceptor oxidoreductase family protein [Desulfovibrio mangrovi]|uniref:2-oxoacid:acceptor oxidoreductase family protein n=1 Tax=Desulfovibrio mangrovi TaxID=2976983 RepID=UPI002247920A|nr:2-oxoacid:acceptor oxidoreductase family protein [Desulfovibrio mangrovi]UZP68063.1 2-oxoacid:acceptor oxidoreductase family protein [Desulfovibrio mangrovi]
MKKLQHIERFEMRLSGTGGQGLITLGRMLGYALAIGHGYYATQTQSYGPEARGGSSRADVVVSSKPISYPKTENLDLLVALSQQACNSYYHYMKRSGILLVDSQLVQQPPTNVYLGLPFTEMATKKIGNPMTLNTIVLGAVTHLLPFADVKAMRTALLENLPKKIHEVNLKAFNLGLKQAKQKFGDAPNLWQSAEAGAEAEADFSD